MRRTLFPILLLAVAGCGSDESPDDLATFEGVLAGAYSATLDGEALYGIARTGGTTAFTILLSDGADFTITLRYDESAQPGTGTYALGAPDDPDTGIFRGSVTYVTSGAAEGFEIRSGTVVVTRSVSGDLDGTVDLRAVRTSPCCDPAPVEITVTGSFDAAPLDANS